MSGAGACRDQYDSWLDSLPEQQPIAERHMLAEDDSFQLLIAGNIGDVEVWLDRGVDFNGIAIGGGESHHAAVEDAIETLERALGILKEQIK